MERALGEHGEVMGIAEGIPPVLCTHFTDHQSVTAVSSLHSPRFISPTTLIHPYPPLLIARNREQPSYTHAPTPNRFFWPAFHCSLSITSIIATPPGPGPSFFVSAQSSQNLPEY